MSEVNSIFAKQILLALNKKPAPFNNMFVPGKMLYSWDLSSSDLQPSLVLQSQQGNATLQHKISDKDLQVLSFVSHAFATANAATVPTLVVEATLAETSAVQEMDQDIFADAGRDYQVVPSTKVEATNKLVETTAASAAVDTVKKKILKKSHTTIEEYIEQEPIQIRQYKRKR